MEKGNLKLLVYKYTQPKMLCTEKGPTSTQINGQGQKIERQLEASDVRSRAYNIFQSNCISFFLFSTKCIQRPVRGSIGSLQELHNTETEENSRTTGAHKPTPAWPHSY